MNTHQAIWTDRQPRRLYPRIDRDVEVDVAVVGAGITGVTAALLLRKAGASVALLDRHHLGDGETRASSAHLSTQLDDRYSVLQRELSEHHLRLVARAARRSVDAIEDLYGPNLLCWTTNFFIKEASNPAFVSWHQDSTYWGLDRPDLVTAWIALTPSNQTNGAVGLLPGTHRKDQVPHRDPVAKNTQHTPGPDAEVAGGFGRHGRSIPGHAQAARDCCNWCNSACRRCTSGR